MEFNESGELMSINNLNELDTNQKKEILSYLWRIRNNRKFKLGRYDLIIQVIDKVEKNITEELKQ